MVKSGVQSARINQASEAQLSDPPKSLKEGVFYDLKDQITGYRDEAIDRIIDDFIFVDFQFEEQISR